jgi:hypothetical protein
LDSIKGRPLIDLRAIDSDLFNAWDERKEQIKTEREEAEEAERQAQIEAERAEAERLDAERQRKIENNELDYEDSNPVVWQELPSKAAEKKALVADVEKFEALSQLRKAETWNGMTGEERGRIGGFTGTPLSASDKDFTPKALSPQEMAQVEAQAKALKANREFIDLPTVNRIRELQEVYELAPTKAEHDDAAQRLSHIARGLERAANAEVPLTSLRAFDRQTGEWGNVAPQTTHKRTPDGYEIVFTEEDGKSVPVVTKLTAEEYGEGRHWLEENDPSELPKPMDESTLVNEFSRPLHDQMSNPGEPVTETRNPSAKTEGPSTPQAFLETHGKITKHDVRLWPADTVARFNRDFPDAARTLLRGEEVTELV